jgi:hypothetical protein
MFDFIFQRNNLNNDDDDNDVNNDIIHLKGCGTHDDVKCWINYEPCGLFCGCLTYVLLGYGNKFIFYNNSIYASSSSSS